MNPESGIFPVGERIASEQPDTTAIDEQWKFVEARLLMPQETSATEEAAPEKFDPALVERIKAKQQRMAEMAARVDAAVAVEERNEASAAKLADILKVGAERRQRMTEDFYRQREADQQAQAEKSARKAVDEAA
jgi:hypothetical protein